MQISRCPACGASVAPSEERCPYCGQFFQRPPSAERKEEEGLPARGSSRGGIVFQRRAEPNEGAFTLLVPQGWRMEGGIQRADLMHQMVDAQSIQAKVDFSVKRDAAGSVLIRWCPEIKYCDVRMSPAGMMGLFPVGSNYQGMLVYPLMSAQQFLVQMVFPWAHPGASQPQVVAQQSQPLLVQAYQQRMAALGLPANFGYDGATVTFTYMESGIRFLERAYTVVENMGPMAGGMWSNKDTLLLRAPQAEFETWEPILHHIRESVQIDLRWLAQEIVSQEFLSRSFLNAQQASMARDRRMLEVQQHLQQMDRQITEHRMQTNAEIHNDAYLNLMNQQEYVNPYTGEPETGSNQWQYRWVTEGGDEYYTDREDDDPNIPSELNRSDWKRTRVRK